MSETTNSGNNFVGFEYKDVTVKKTMQSVYADSYKNFGWILEGNSDPVGKPDFITMKFKRERKISNKAELTRLQRQFNAYVAELLRLKGSKKTKAAVVAYVVGVIGTAFIAGSVFAVTAGNVGTCDHIPIPITRDQEVIISRNKMKIDDICYRIIKRKGTKYKFAKMLFYLLMAPLYKMIRQPVINALMKKAKEPLDTKLKYFELMPLTDKSITVNEKCNGYGTCAKVCPVNNIKIVDKKTEFQHRCEMCFHVMNGVRPMRFSIGVDMKV